MLIKYQALIDKMEKWGLVSRLGMRPTKKYKLLLSMSKQAVTSGVKLPAQLRRK